MGHDGAPLVHDTFCGCALTSGASHAPRLHLLPCPSPSPRSHAAHDVMRNAYPCANAFAAPPRHTQANTAPISFTLRLSASHAAAQTATLVVVGRTGRAAKGRPAFNSPQTPADERLATRPCRVHDTSRRPCWRRAIGMPS
eukprot:scaffold32221_cov157-Isochrysis_galbana.AAC.2